MLKQKQPAVANSDDGLLTVTGIVRMRDGSPVAGATVRSITGLDDTGPVARTDDGGRFQLQGVFEGGGRLHVSSPDGSYQAVLKVPTGRLMRPIESKLRQGSRRFMLDASGPCKAASSCPTAPMLREFWLRAMDLDLRTTEISRAPAHEETGHFNACEDVRRQGRRR